MYEKAHVILASACLLLAVAASLGAGTRAAADSGPETLVVTATAFNSLPGQTSGDPEVAAWGDRLSPGMKAIAVSRDLIELGLGHRSFVEIEGMGEFEVLDKMHRRWERRIDIYMGEDVSAARHWGVRNVRIRW